MRCHNYYCSANLVLKTYDNYIINYSNIDQHFGINSSEMLYLRLPQIK
jgi:hypothetical protein